MNTQNRKHYFVRKFAALPLRKEVVDTPSAERYRNTIYIPEHKASHQSLVEYCWISSRHVERWAILNDRLQYARELFSGCVHSDPAIRGGVPVLRGTRVPISLILANLASNMSVEGIADDLGLDKEQIRAFIKCLAIAFDRPQHEYDSARRVYDFKSPDARLCCGGQDYNSGVSKES